MRKILIFTVLNQKLIYCKSTKNQIQRNFTSEKSGKHSLIMIKYNMVIILLNFIKSECA